MKIVGKTLFATHGQTHRNADCHYYDEKLEKMKYFEMAKNLSKEELPAENEIAQGQADESLILKGQLEALILAEQVKEYRVDRIFCGNQARCIETAQIVAQKIGLDPACVYPLDRLSARNYGIISDKGIEVDRLKHFWKYPISLKMLKIIAFYLIAPEKIGVEKKSTFQDRILSFIKNKSIIMENTFIIGGSDIETVIRDCGFDFNVVGEEEEKLARGQLMVVDFCKAKVNPNLREKPKSNKKGLDEHISNIQ